MFYAFVSRLRHETSGIARTHIALIAIALGTLAV